MNIQDILGQRIQPEAMNSSEQRVVEKLIKEGVAVDPKQHYFDRKLASIIIRCPDGTKSSYLLDLLKEVYKPQMRQHLQHHDFTKHGGAILLAPDSPIIPKGRTTDIDLLDDIDFSVKKGFRSIILTAHFPCAMARHNNMPPFTVIDSLVQAKNRIKETLKELAKEALKKAKEAMDNENEAEAALKKAEAALYNSVTVACFLQCTYPGKNPGDIQESLYFISRTAYENWRRRNSEF